MHVRADRAVGPVQGILSGKTIYLSAGHGFTWTDFGWRTQRGNTNGIVEDLVSIEAVNQFLIPYLHAMGAYVVTVREPDLGSEAVIVDDGSAVVEGTPEETPVADAGWGEVALPIVDDDVNPFASGGARALVAKTDATGGLVYDADLPADGFYNVYASYVQGPDRVSDAHFVVRHSGGETHMRLDQRRHGSTWVLLGRFHFEAGDAAVAVLDDSVDAGAIVSVDAVRWGGGMAVHDRGGGTNDRPLAEQCARYYTQWNGAPPSVFAAASDDGTSDVGARSRFAAWEHEDGEDAVYVAWHSNAPTPRRGTSSYTYGAGPPPQPLSSFSGVPGSLELQAAIHQQIIEDVRSEWDPEWTDEGQYTAYFGEVNPSHNPEMPAVLLEVAYHDTLEDADQLRDPGFRRIMSRAIAQGIAEYFAERDGVPLVLPPEPPSAVWVRNDGDGGLEVGWREPEATPGGGDPPTGYFVRVSTNGLGFDDGAWVEETRFTLDGLAPGDVRFVRIEAANEGGRSLPSHVVGAAVAASGRASVLVVGGFDRLDAGQLPVDDLSAFDLDVVQRMVLRRMNEFAYAERHGHAVVGAGFSFDGATDDAIELGDVALGGYQAVDWFTGEDSVGNAPLAAISRDALADYLDGGGRVFISGAELGWALDEYGMPDEQAFFNERLHARYVADDAETYAVDPVPDGPFADVGALAFDDPTVYDPRFPDVLEPEAGGAIALVYADGLDSGAAIAWGDAGERGVLMGFPFETIADPQTRIDLMAAILDFFEVVEEDPEDPGGESSGTSDGSSGTDDTAPTDSTATATSPPDTDTDTDGEASSTSPSGCACRSTPLPPKGTVALFVLCIAATRRRARPNLEAR
jgi:N-acetylmuramoyl-L-alanine amidase